MTDNNTPDQEMEEIQAAVGECRHVPSNIDALGRSVCRCIARDCTKPNPSPHDLNALMGYVEKLGYCHVSFTYINKKLQLCTVQRGENAKDSYSKSGENKSSALRTALVQAIRRGSK